MNPVGTISQLEFTEFMREIEKRDMSTPVSINGEEIIEFPDVDEDSVRGSFAQDREKKLLAS